MFVITESSSQTKVNVDGYIFEIGSVIQYGKPGQYGKIKWIGKPPDETETFVGLEMVKHGDFDDHFKYVYVIA